MIQRVLMGLGLSVVALYLAVCVAIFFYQRSLIYFPQSRAINRPEATLHLDARGTDLVVTIRSLESRKAILYFGGNGEDVSLNLETFSRWFPDHALYLLHYRGFGGSQGKPGEEAFHADAAELFRYVQLRHPEVSVIGRSLGSGVAVRLASEQAVSRLALITPYDSIQAVAADQFPWLPVRWLTLDKFESFKYAPRIKAPTTLLVAGNDEVIGKTRSESLFRAFQPGVASMRVIPDSGHNNIQDRSEYLAALRAAMAVLPGP